MLPTKLFTYIASSLLANTLIVESLPPVYAKSSETTKSGNPVERLALNPSSATYTDSRTEIYSTQSNQGEVIPSPFTFNTSGLMTTTITGMGRQFLIQDFDSTLMENDIEVLNAIELDLDSILDTEFEQKGVILISRCCL